MDLLFYFAGKCGMMKRGFGEIDGTDSGGTVMAAFVELKHVKKIYRMGEVVIKAVDDMSFSIEKGEFVFFVGSSGSGKSTLIKLLMKELNPTSGQILINNINTTTMRRSQIPYLRRNLGIVFQDFRLLPNKTVYENVAFDL